MIYDIPRGISGTDLIPWLVQRCYEGNTVRLGGSHASLAPCADGSYETRYDGVTTRYTCPMAAATAAACVHMTVGPFAFVRLLVG